MKFTGDKILDALVSDQDPNDHSSLKFWVLEYLAGGRTEEIAAALNKWAKEWEEDRSENDLTKSLNHLYKEGA